MSANSLPPNDLPVSFYLMKSCKLWLWDFDDTLITTETYMKRNLTPSLISKLSDCDLDVDFPQWQYFKRLIDFLVTHGKYVGIVSFGTYEIIRAYMNRVFGFNQRFFGKHNIIAPCMKDRDTRRFSVPPNKNEYIYQLMKIYRVQDFGRVVLFDDMPSNISSATSIGVIGVQIATPRNGDIDASKFYFGPWLMNDLDKKLEKTCCEGSGSGSGSGSDSNNSTTHSKALLINTEPFLGDKFNYTNSAYGTCIGDRKTSKKPEHRWNKMNIQNPPKWQNGNWQTNGGTMSIDSYPDSTLGGYSLSFWDTHQSVLRNNVNNISSNVDYGSKEYDTSNIEEPNNLYNLNEGFQSSGNSNSNSNSNHKTLEQVSSYNNKYIKNKFTNSDDCQSCKKINWDWITLSLMITIFMMVAIVFSISS